MLISPKIDPISCLMLMVDLMPVLAWRAKWNGPIANRL